MTFHVPEQHRRVHPTEGPSRGLCGFFVCIGPLTRMLNIIASSGMGWEHVSVSLAGAPKSIPHWLEMCHIKSLFWDEEDTVVQYHPRKSDYVNHHPGCLHLWRPTEAELPTPPSIMVGPR